MAEATPEVQVEPPAAAMDPATGTKNLARFIRCRPGRPRNYCNGTGVVLALVDGVRVKRLCACIDTAIKLAEEAKAARLAVGDLAARASDLDAPPAASGPRHVPKGAHDRLAQLRRELAKETDKLTAMREKVGAAIGGIADQLAALTYEEAENKRGAVAAAAMKKLASEQLEEVRARLEGLRADVEQATAELELLTNQSGQFGARRMTLEARLTDERKRHAPNEKAAADRMESLEYRLRAHLARWPELAEVAPS